MLVDVGVFSEKPASSNRSIGRSAVLVGLFVLTYLSQADPIGRMDRYCRFVLSVRGSLSAGIGGGREPRSGQGGKCGKTDEALFPSRTETG